jgi:hypothetical protein
MGRYLFGRILPGLRPPTVVSGEHLLGSALGPIADPVKDERGRTKVLAGIVEIICMSNNSVLSE